MRRNRIWTVLSFACWIVAAVSTSVAGNRFNVFVYQDGSNYVNQGAFYDSISVFGASHAYVYHPHLIPDSIKDSVNFFSSYSWETDFVIDDSAQLRLFHDLIETQHTELHAEYQNAVLGYFPSDSSSEYGFPVLSRIVPDAGLQRDVRQALEGVGTPQVGSIPV